MLGFNDPGPNLNVNIITIHICTPFEFSRSCYEYKKGESRYILGRFFSLNSSSCKMSRVENFIFLFMPKKVFIYEQNFQSHFAEVAFS